MRGIGLSRGGFWGFLALSFALGLIIGVGLLLWQRAAMLGEIRQLEKRLANSVKEAAESDADAAELRERLSSTEASMGVLASQNTSLASELTSATTALAEARTALAAATAGGTVGVSTVSATPNPVSAGTTLTITAMATGAPSKVTVRVFSKQRSVSYNKTYTMARTSSLSGVDTWTYTFSAPPAGNYGYYVYVYKGTSNTPAASNLTGTFSAK